MRLLVFSPPVKPLDLSSAPTEAACKSVRDFPMRGKRSGTTAIITMTVGGRRQKYPISDVTQFAWKLRYDQLKVLEAMFGHWDDEPGGPCQAQRLREGFLNIIEQLIGTYKPPTKRK